MHVHDCLVGLRCISFAMCGILIMHHEMQAFEVYGVPINIITLISTSKSFEPIIQHSALPFCYNMTYEVEDEVDWSDGTLDDPPSTSTGASGNSAYVSSAVQEEDGLDYFLGP